MPLAKGASLVSYQGETLLVREVPAEHRPDLRLDAPLDLVLGAQIGQFMGRACSMPSTVHGRWTVVPTEWVFGCWGRRCSIRVNR